MANSNQRQVWRSEAQAQRSSAHAGARSQGGRVLHLLDALEVAETRKANLEHEARALAEMHARVCGERDAALAASTSPDRVREISLEAVKVYSEVIFDSLLRVLAAMKTEQLGALSGTKEETYGRAGYVLALEDIEGAIKAALAVRPEVSRG